jgi:NAD(P)-dependent dehydrogenase (short-subunit alcohol dehydrogenase family)
MNTWLITGCATGFGALLARMALDRGDTVVATDRDTAALAHLAHGARGRLLALPLDVTDPASVAAAAEAALARFGPPDVLVNNAGLGDAGPFEEADPERVRLLFEVNTFGVIRVTQALLPAMRARGSGHIINISSDSGVVGWPFQSIYCATKHAVEGFSESLSHEIAPFGLKVTLVEPCGFFRTAMPIGALAEAKRRLRETSPYYAMVAARIAAAEAVLPEASDPRLVPEAILELADMPDPPLRRPVGPPERTGLLAARQAMPDEAFVRMIRTHS